MFSRDRWACVGEAGLFADPFYSPGMWQIALSNGVAAQMIRREREGALSAADVDAMNDTYVQVNDELTRSIQSTFEYSDRPAVVAAKLLWDFATGWPLTGALVINDALVDEHKRRSGLHADPRFWHLSRVMRALLVQWGERSTGRLGFSFIDYQAIPFMRELYRRVLRRGKDAAELARDHEMTMNLLEDVMPEELAAMPQPVWLNSWALSLDRDTWQRRGLLKPTTTPRDSDRVRRELSALFQRQSSASRSAH